jgi:hypothetical protein
VLTRQILYYLSHIPVPITIITIIVVVVFFSSVLFLKDKMCRRGAAGNRVRWEGRG